MPKQGSPSTETGDKVKGRDMAAGVRGDAQVGVEEVLSLGLPLLRAKGSKVIGWTEGGRGGGRGLKRKTV